MLWYTFCTSSSSSIFSINISTSFLCSSIKLFSCLGILSKFDEIISQIRLLSKNYKNPLVVVVGGTTAAALSYELNMTNITCYDFGQFNRFYKQSIKNKVSANEK